MRLRREGLIWRRAGEEVIALDVETSQYLSANQTAAAVWDALAEGATEDDLVAVLCTRFEVDPDVARADVIRLVETLRAEGLVEP